MSDMKVKRIYDTLLKGIMENLEDEDVIYSLECLFRADKELMMLDRGVIALDCSSHDDTQGNGKTSFGLNLAMRPTQLDFGKNVWLFYGPSFCIDFDLPEKNSSEIMALLDQEMAGNSLRSVTHPTVDNFVNRLRELRDLYSL